MRRFASVLLAASLGVGLSAAWAWGDAAPKRPALESPPRAALELTDFTLTRQVGDPKAVESEQQPGVQVLTDPGGLLVEFPKQEPLSSVRPWQAAAKDADWSAYDYLRLRVKNAGPVRTTVWLYLYDEKAWAAAKHAFGTVESAPLDDVKRAAFGAGVDPGREADIAVPLAPLYRADGSGALDLAKMSRLRLAFERQPEPGKVVLEKLTLLKVFDGPKPFLFFDFYGADRIPVAGTLPVTPKSEYSKKDGYGLASPKDLSPVIRAGGKFPVFGDGIAGSKVPFVADVPNGKYEVQAIAFAMDGQGVHLFGYSIDAQGKRVVDAPLTEDVFYSGQGLYWGADRFHDPTRTLWAQYGREYFKPHVFQAEVTDGQLHLDFNNCGVYAMWIYPADQAAAGRARVEAIQGEQDWRVATSMARLAEGPDAGAPAEPDAAAKARGYLLFARHYTLMVYPNRNPRPEELVKKLALAAAPGEYEPTTFAVRPLKDLKSATVEVSDLAGPDGAVVPKAAVKVDLVKYFPLKGSGIDYTLTPSYLFPYRPLDLYKDFNRQYWLCLLYTSDAADE